MAIVSEYEKTGKLQRKIDISVLRGGRFTYYASTQWHKSCKEAIASTAAKLGLPLYEVKARFAK